MEEGELDCSLANINRVWEQASKLVTPESDRKRHEKRKEMNGTLGDLTPGIFDIGRHRQAEADTSVGNPWAGYVPVGQKEEWLAKDLSRRGRVIPDYDICWQKLQGEEEEMLKQYQAMNEDLDKLRKDRDRRKTEGEEMEKRIAEQTARIEADRKYQSEKMAEEGLALAKLKEERTRMETEIEEEQNRHKKDKDEKAQEIVRLKDRKEREQVRLDKDREEARKSRELRDTYELEITRQSGRVKEIKKQYDREESSNRALHEQYEEERQELGEARDDIKRELESLNRKRAEMNDSYLAYKLQMEEEKRSLEWQEHERNQRAGPQVSSTPRTILKPYSPFEKEGAMANVEKGKYGKEREGPVDGDRRVTIGGAETKNISSDGGGGMNHSYGSLNPFANDPTSTSYHVAPQAPVYNITYQYGGLEEGGKKSESTPGGRIPPPRTQSSSGTSSKYPNVAGRAPQSGQGARDGDERSGTIGLARRASMTPAMMAIGDSDECIRNMGVDCCSRTVGDASDIMDWSRRQSDRLIWTPNAARKTTREPRKFTGEDWKQSYQDFCDDNTYHGWDKEASLGPLIRWLSDGPGRIAVDEWRQTYGEIGTYDQLVASATYNFGTLAANDPWQEFQIRTQKPTETAKIFGLELQRLLQRARPLWRKDDEYFLDELFTHYIRGLRNSAHAELVQKEWKRGSSMMDFFLAIDQYEKKKRLLAGFSPQSRMNSVLEHRESQEMEETDEERFAALGDKKKWWKKPVNEKKEKEKEETVIVKAVQPVVEISESEKRMVAMMNEMKGLLEYRRKPKVDRATVKCFRCQDMGHYAAECTAEKPVWRERRVNEQEN